MLTNVHITGGPHIVGFFLYLQLRSRQDKFACLGRKKCQPEQPPRGSSTAARLIDASSTTGTGRGLQCHGGHGPVMAMARFYETMELIWNKHGTHIEKYREMWKNMHKKDGKLWI